MIAVVIAPYTGGNVAAHAGPAGELDPAFNGGGIVTTDFSGLADTANGVAIQPDGKLIVAGGSGTDFGMARYDPDGTLDIGFGNGGIVTTDFAGGIDVARAVAIQPDGKIVAVGSAYQSGNDNVALARYLSSGAPDTSFDVDGKVSTDFTGGADGANAVALQPDGKIVVAGRASVPGTVDFGLVRYNSDGSPDPTFGTGGTVHTDIAGVFNQAFGMVLQPDGKIVAAGQVSVGSSDIALVRYLPTGYPDPGFGGDGIVRTDLGDFDQARAVAIQPDGKIVTAGVTFTPGADFALVRYHPDGRPDLGFDGDSVVRTDFTAGADEALAVAIQRDGRIVAAGAATVADQVDFGLVRYLPDGRPDPGFGTAGKVTTDVAEDVDAANAVLVQPDGRTVAAGRAVVAGSSDVALIRYRAGTGCPHTRLLR